MQVGEQGAGCGSIMTERNRYYTGKYMTARDFQGEQEYFRSRHQMHNRLLHGSGIVCGLEVRKHTDAGCQNSFVVVKAGIALDCCGREIVLAADTAFEVRPIPASPAPAPPQTSGATAATPAAEPTQLLLCLFYTEKPIEYTPAIYSDGSCEAQGEQANRVSEVASLKLLHLNEVKADCWNRGSLNAKCRDDCGDSVSGTETPCFEPACSCGQTVPLALLSFGSDPYTAIEIDGSGRRHLPMHADFLTHVVGMNWTHGGQITLSQLRQQMKGRLEVRFDRKLKATPENSAYGVSAFSFIVQFGGVQEDIRYLPFKYMEPPRLEGDCLAVFAIDPRYLDPAETDDLKGKVIYVTLKCDFIVDCRGVAVDGAHLGGTLPTRSGRAGGVFESWFYVIDEDHPADGQEQRSRPRPRRVP